MRVIRLAPLALAALSACNGSTPPDPVLVTPGALLAGVAESSLDLPVGTPLGGFTGRLLAGAVDGRESDYALRFSPSAGIQTRPPVKAFWFDNGQENLVVLKTDLIYSSDDLVTEVERRLSTATGLDLAGRVVVAVSHTHNSYGNFSSQPMFFLGGDKYNYENFTRLAQTLEDAALLAWEARQEALVGVAQWRDWDPDDQVYRDRRGDNDDIQLFDDIPAGSFKDPLLWMLRVDTLQHEPLGVLYGFGMHGTVLDYDNQMVSVDAPGHTEVAFQDTFDRPVVVAHLQGGGGDASPAGEDDFYARLESIGDRAAPSLQALWSSIVPAAATATLETRTHAVPETRDDIHVTRNGTVDWSYLPYEEGYEPDLQVWDDQGGVLSPVDEFTAPYGAAFCGEAAAYLGDGMGVDIPPYTGCTPVDDFTPYLATLFQMPEEELALPLKECKRATVTTTRLGPLATTLADGTTGPMDLFVGFFPGETTAMYVEMFRRRAGAELGFTSAVAVGYAQDHEGYILTTEDWLQGGYENEINVWGPLQGDHLMDHALEMSSGLLTEELEPMDPWDQYQPESWGPYALEVHTPDPTPDAGTLLTTPPDYLFSPLYSADERDIGLGPTLAWSDEVPRVQGIVEMAWKGGDPAVDLPRVVLERSEGGTWTEVLTHAGRPVTDALPDLLLAWTPDPLEPEDGEAQDHLWWAAWQVVGHQLDRAGVPEGTYRLHVTGQRCSGGTSWPFQSTAYEVTSPPFTVVPGSLTVTASGADLRVSIHGPDRGWRHVAAGGSYRGDNPLSGSSATATFTLDDGSSQTNLLVGEDSSGATVFTGAIPSGAVSVEVSDRYGNTGSLLLTP